MVKSIKPDISGTEMDLTEERGDILIVLKELVKALILRSEIYTKIGYFLFPSRLW